MLRRLLPFLLLVVPATALAGSGASPVISNIALAMVGASVFGVIARLLRQPLLLGYVLAGVLLGPLGLKLVSDQAEIAEISELGLILLLFMIGLEIDLKKMSGAGRWVIVPGVVQFPLGAAFAAVCIWGLSALGLKLGASAYDVLYLAVALSLSSTMIVVKLLYDKLELDSLAGRITVGILVFQDLWAILVLAVQPNLAKPDAWLLARTFLGGLLLVAAALVASRYLLPRIFHLVAKVPELMVILSLGWCFAVGLIAALPALGLSMGMGALIAGVSLATFPYNLDVNARVLNIRDFFITLFFVSLGMQMSLPSFPVLLGALLLSVILLLARAVGVFGVLKSLRADHGTSLLATINLAQVSEFSLVVVTLGVALGHVSRELLALVMWTFAICALFSSYAIAGSAKLQRVVSRVLGGLGWRDGQSRISEVRRANQRGVLLLGYFRVARAFVEDVARREQHLLDHLKVIDFNPKTGLELGTLGVPVVYGDISNLDTLHHAGIEEARVVMCSIADTFLRGTTNEKLLRMLKPLCPHARLIFTSETPEQTVALYDAGADFVLQPNVLAGHALVNVVEQALRGSFDGMREEAAADLASRAGSWAVVPK